MSFPCIHESKRCKLSKNMFDWGEGKRERNKEKHSRYCLFVLNNKWNHNGKDFTQSTMQWNNNLRSIFKLVGITGTAATAFGVKYFVTHHCHISNNNWWCQSYHKQQCVVHDHRPHHLCCGSGNYFPCFNTMLKHARK